MAACSIFSASAFQKAERIEHAAIRPVRQLNHLPQIHLTAHSKSAHSGQPWGGKSNHRTAINRKVRA
jgi:hypothetical protein